MLEIDDRVTLSERGLAGKRPRNAIKIGRIVSRRKMPTTYFVKWDDEISPRKHAPGELLEIPSFGHLADMIDAMAEDFACGVDTHDLSRIYGIPESAIYNALAKYHASGVPQSAA